MFDLRSSAATAVAGFVSVVMEWNVSRSVAACTRSCHVLEV